MLIRLRLQPKGKPKGSTSEVRTDLQAIAYAGNGHALPS